MGDFLSIAQKYKRKNFVHNREKFEHNRHGPNFSMKFSFTKISTNESFPNYGSSPSY